MTGKRAARQPRLAAVTMVRDEAAMLPRWIDHYSRQCDGPASLVVLDDNSKDGSTDDLPCSVIRIPEETKKRYFERSRMKMSSGIAAGLLAVYDAVMFTDADEFLVADPAKYETLTDLVWDRPGVEALAALCLNVVHHVGAEGDLDPAQPILAQRRLGKFIPRMCKPALKRTPAAWTAASHGLTAPYSIDEDLYLFHAKFADRETLHGTAEHRQWITDTYGRAKTSTWGLGADKMTKLLDKAVAEGDPSGAPEFAPPSRAELDAIVQRRKEGELWSSRGANQFKAMKKQPFVTIPERFSHSV